MSDVKETSSQLQPTVGIDPKANERTTNMSALFVVRRLPGA
jgi:hypothetical protein